MLNLVKERWVAGFAACMVNGQLAIAYPLYSHIHYITKYCTKSYMARDGMNGSIAWPTAHPEEWLWMHHEVRMEAQRAGKLTITFLSHKE